MKTSLMCALSKLVVALRWDVLIANLDSDTRNCQMRERSARSTEGCPDYVVGPPHLLNNQHGESIRPKKEEEAAGDCVGDCLLVICDLIANYLVEVGDHGRASEKHVDKEVAALLVSFTACAHVSMGRIKSKDKVQKYLEFHISHATVVA